MWWFRRSGVVSARLYGARIRLHVADDLAARHFMEGHFEAPLPQAIAASVRAFPGAFIDVGANSGVYSILAAQLGAEVHAFEPLPEALSYLKRNIAMNSKGGRIKVHEIALSDRNGSADLYLPLAIDVLESSASLDASFKPDSVPTYSVPIRRFDDLGITGIGVIKADIEGHEAAFIEGAEQSIARERPIIFAEIIVPSVADRLNAFMQRNDYLNFDMIEGSIATTETPIAIHHNGWNHALVPREKADRFASVMKTAGVSVR